MLSELEEAQLEEAPDDLRCPISYELFEDPVLASDGFNYERRQIEKWFENHRTSPKTNARLKHRRIYPNHLLRARCLEWKASHSTDAGLKKQLKAFTGALLTAETSVEALSAVQKIGKLIRLARNKNFLILGPASAAKLFKQAQFAETVNDRVAAAFSSIVTLCALHVRERKEEYIKLQNMQAASAFAARSTEGSLHESFENLAGDFAAQSIALGRRLEELGEALPEEEGISLNSTDSGSGEVGGKRKASASSTRVPHARPSKQAKMKAGGKVSSHCLRVGGQILCEEGDDLYGGRQFKIQDMERGQIMIEAAAIVGCKMGEAYCRFHGWCGLVQDDEKAFSIFKGIAEETGSAYAENMLGICYEEGNGVTQDMAKAIECYAKAAEKGHSDAMNLLGMCYFDGLGVNQNMTKAFEWYLLAAEKGHSGAMYNLAMLYYHGIGVAVDLTKAIRWFRNSAEKGVCAAVNGLGMLYFNGIGMLEDLSKAVDCFTESAKKGHPAASYNLGVCFFNGLGVKQNVIKAAELYNKGAEKGNIDAMNNFGGCLFNGAGVKQNRTKAFEWYSKAAVSGNVTAMFNLGYCFLHGEGVEQDLTKAAEWLTRSAENGHSAAMLNLGTLYFRGDGLAEDLTLAMEWYSKARDAGETKAQSQIDAINNRLSNQQQEQQSEELQ